MSKNPSIIVLDENILKQMVAAIKQSDATISELRALECSPPIAQVVETLGAMLEVCAAVLLVETERRKAALAYRRGFFGV